MATEEIKIIQACGKNLQDIAPISPILWPCGQLLVASGPHTSASPGQVLSRLAIYRAPHVKLCTLMYFRTYFVMTHTKQEQYQHCNFPYL